MRAVVHPCPAVPPTAPPTADEAHVWVVALDRPPCDPADLAAALTPDERDRAERYRAGSVREQFVVTRGLVRRILSGYLGTAPHAVPITYVGNGKPVLADSSLHFNVTH